MALRQYPCFSILTSIKEAYDARTGLPSETNSSPTEAGTEAPRINMEHLIIDLFSPAQTTSLFFYSRLFISHTYLELFETEELPP